jgi:hypothetical protein
MTRMIGSAFAIGLIGLATAVAADTPAPSTDIQPADIAQLVEQLESPAFAERQEATRQLSEAGKAAFAELEKASASSSREASARALDVLKGHFQRGDKETKAAAAETLERLATSNNAAISERARNILKPPPMPSAADIANGFGNAQIRVANLQLQIARNPPAQGRSTSVTRSANGAITIQVRENGKITKIVSTPGGKIDVEITQTQNGQPVTKKMEFKDLDELKKKEAEIARIYEQHSQPIRVQVGAIRPAGAILPNNRLVPPVPQQSAESLKQRIQSLEASIQQQKAQLPNNPAGQQSIDSLQRNLQFYEDRLRAAEKPAAAVKSAEAAGEAKAVGGQ